MIEPPGGRPLRRAAHRRLGPRRLRVKGGKTPYENMFSGLPQTADIGVACRKEIPLAASVEPPSNFRVGQAWTLRSDPPDQPLAPAPRRRVGARRLQPQRHGTSSGRAHVICQTTRVAAFGLAAGFHIISTADRAPRNVSLLVAILLWVCSVRLT
jgi:hypothetical protein